MLNQFNQILKDKIKLYQELKTILQEEKNVLVKGNISRFQNFLTKKELIIKKLRDIEEKRKTVLKEIAHEMGLPFEGISLSKIIKKASSPISVELKKSRIQLIELINSIDKLNLYNEKLVSKSSLSNEKILDFFSCFYKGSFYAQDGKIGSSNPTKSWMLNAEA